MQVRRTNHLKGGRFIELNTQIKRYRTELKLSKEDLAEKVYVTRQNVSNWENGKKLSRYS